MIDGFVDFIKFFRLDRDGKKRSMMNKKKLKCKLCLLVTKKINNLK